MHNKKSNIELKKNLERENFERFNLSFYKYCLIDNPKDLRNKLYLDLINLKIIGRIYVSEEGINAQVCVPKHNLEIFKSYIHSIDLFSDIKFKHAIEEGISFSKLKILVRNEIVAYKIPKGSYDMKKIGVHLKPIDFHRSIKEKDSVVVDMRNYYESEVGRFKNAIEGVALGGVAEGIFRTARYIKQRNAEKYSKIKPNKKILDEDRNFLKGFDENITDFKPENVTQDN